MTGCENFLNGENIKDDIVREIYISNHECPEAKVSDYYASFFAGSAVPHKTCDFDQNVAAEDVSKAREKGLVYYAAVVHFAKGESAVSEVYTMLGF